MVYIFFSDIKEIQNIRDLLLKIYTNTIDNNTILIIPFKDDYFTFYITKHKYNETISFMKELNIIKKEIKTDEHFFKYNNEYYYEIYRIDINADKQVKLLSISHNIIMNKCDIMNILIYTAFYFNINNKSKLYTNINKYIDNIKNIYDERYYYNLIHDIFENINLYDSKYIDYNTEQLSIENFPYIEFKEYNEKYIQIKKNLQNGIKSQIPLELNLQIITKIKQDIIIDKLITEQNFINNYYDKIIDNDKSINQQEIIEKYPDLTQIKDNDLIKIIKDRIMFNNLLKTINNKSFNDSYIFYNSIRQIFDIKKSDILKNSENYKFNTLLHLNICKCFLKNRNSMFKFVNYYNILSINIKESIDDINKLIIEEKENIFIGGNYLKINGGAGRPRPAGRRPKTIHSLISTNQQ